MTVPTDGQQPPTPAPGGGEQDKQPAQGKMYTQAELDALFGQVRRDEREKFADYKDLKAKAAKFDQAETEKLSEAEKAKQEKEAADQRAAAAIKTANERLMRAAFIAEASQLGVKNPVDAYALAIADGAKVAVDEAGNVTGATEAVKALVDAGRLVLGGRAGAPGLDAGAGGQTRPEKTIVLTDEQKRLAQYAGMTEEQYIKYLTMPSVSLGKDADGQPK